MLGTKQGWTMAPDGAQFRRVVASPAPQRVLGLQPIKWLLAQGALVIAAGGGIPVARLADGHTLQGVEAVVDKDTSSSLLARQLGAELLIIATDVNAVYLDFGQPTQRRIRRVTPAALAIMQVCADGTAAL